MTGLENALFPTFEVLMGIAMVTSIVGWFLRSPEHPGSGVPAGGRRFWLVRPPRGLRAWYRGPGFWFMWAGNVTWNLGAAVGIVWLVLAVLR